MSTFRAVMRIFVILAVFLVIMQGSAWSQLSDKSLLFVETGRHADLITDISASKDGAIFATSSRDRTVRIWNAAGRQLQVIFPSVDDEVNEAVNSVALSQDGDLVAYQFSKRERLDEKGAFVITYPIQVLNLRTHKLEHLGRTFEPVRMSFSPDGRYLGWITAFYSEFGLQIDVRRTSDWALYARASIDKAGIGLPATFDFSPDGNRIAITYADQTQVLSINGSNYASKNLYDTSTCNEGGHSCAGLQEDLAIKKRMIIERSIKPAHGKTPVGVKWSPSGRWLAFGYVDTPAVTLVSSGSWRQFELPAKDLERAYLNGPETMSILAWSSDSQTLLSSGTMGAKLLMTTIIRQWSVGSKPTYVDIESTRGRDQKLVVTGIVRTTSGYAFSSDDSLGFFGGTRFRVLEPVAGLRGTHSIYNNPAGTSFYFYYKSDGDSYSRFMFDAITRVLKPDESELPTSFRTLEKAPGMDHFGMRTNAPILNGVRLEIDSSSGAFAFTSDGQSVVIGTSFTLYRFDRTGTKIWSVKLPARATAINTSRDGRLILVVLYDGTLRWYRLLDGKSLLAFYALNDQRTWAMWTPDGFFDTSEGSDIVLFKRILHSDGLIHVEPMSRYSSMRRPDKITDALLMQEFTGESVPIPTRPGLFFPAPI